MTRPEMSDNKYDGTDDGRDETRVNGRKGKVLEVSLKMTCPYITHRRSTQNGAAVFFARPHVQAPSQVIQLDIPR
jgi:hypothetical protein